MAEILAAGVDVHHDLADVLDYFASVRPKVVVISGAGSEFLTAPPDRPGHAAAVRHQFGDRDRAWKLLRGIIRCHHQLAEMDPIVVASVNGDAIGFGASIVLGADFVVAAEDAVIADHHASLDELEGMNRQFTLIPGDGGAALAPGVLPTGWANGYAYLGRPLDPAALAAAGLIYAAVPRNEVVSATDELVARLLRRSRYTLAWTKRVMNRRRVQELNLTMDSSVAYEWLSALFADDPNDGDVLGITASVRP